jgi:RNA polymerase sigma-70 factor, ECF subfamily
MGPPKNMPADPSPPADDPSTGWKSVFEESAAGLRAFLRSRLSQESDVDDCLQAVYVKMVQSGATISANSRKAWLFRVAANESAGFWRKKASINRMLQQQTTSQEYHADPATQLIHNETSIQLDQALDKLPADHREVIRLKIIHDLTFQQIATQLNIPLGTALTRMRRGLERLREELQNDL